MPITLPIYVDLANIIDSQWYRPNGQEYLCRICNRIIFSRDGIRQHVKEHKIGDIVNNI